MKIESIQGFVPFILTISDEHELKAVEDMVYKYHNPMDKEKQKVVEELKVLLEKWQ